MAPYYAPPPPYYADPYYAAPTTLFPNTFFAEWNGPAVTTLALGLGAVAVATVGAMSSKEESYPQQGGYPPQGQQQGGYPG